MVSANNCGGGGGGGGTVTTEAIVPVGADGGGGIVVVGAVAPVAEISALVACSTTNTTGVAAAADVADRKSVDDAIVSSIPTLVPPLAKNGVGGVRHCPASATRLCVSSSNAWDSMGLGTMPPLLPPQPPVLVKDVVTSMGCTAVLLLLLLLLLETTTLGGKAPLSGPAELWDDELMPPKGSLVGECRKNPIQWCEYLSQLLETFRRHKSNGSTFIVPTSRAFSLIVLRCCCCGRQRMVRTADGRFSLSRAFLIHEFRRKNDTHAHTTTWCLVLGEHHHGIVVTAANDADASASLATVDWGILWFGANLSCRVS
jgi:hypothetical protein